MNRSAILFVIACLSGCGLGPRKSSIEDAHVQELLQAAQSLHKEEYGFSPLPVDPATDIRLETSKGAYDEMLHIYGRTSRTLAFRKLTSGYQCIHEQEGFSGPGWYDSPDGRLQELIYITYETERVAGTKIRQPEINYYGIDPRLRNSSSLTVLDIIPILKEWGYKTKE